MGLIDAATASALGAAVKIDGQPTTPPSGADPAVPVASVPPSPPPPAVVPATTPAPPAPTPATPPTTPPAPAVMTVEALAAMQRETQTALNTLVQSLVNREIESGRERAPQTKSELDELVERLAETNPDLGVMGKLLVETTKRLDTMTTRDRMAAAEAEATDAMMKDVNRLWNRFPGLEQADIEKVLVYAGDEKNKDEVTRSSFMELAENVLGLDHLEARRTPKGVSPADPPPPTTPAPVATVVTDAAIGSGPAPTSPSAGEGTVRDGMKEFAAEAHKAIRFQ